MSGKLLLWVNQLLKVRILKIKNIIPITHLTKALLDGRSYGPSRQADKEIKASKERNQKTKGAALA